MIVVDSSAVVDLLVDPGARGTAAARHLAGESLLRAPSLIDSEVASVLLRLERSGTLPEDKTIRAVTDYRTLPLRRYDHLPLWSTYGSSGACVPTTPSPSPSPKDSAPRC